MIIPELYLDNAVVFGTGVMKARAFSTGAEGLFTGRTVTGFLSLGDTTDASPISGLTWSFAEDGALASYWAELLGSAITANAAAYVAGQTPLFPHFVSGQDYHEIGSAVVVKDVRPLVGLPTSLVWDNDFFVRVKLTRQSVADGSESPWGGAALNVFLSTGNSISDAAIHASLNLGVGTGLTEIAAGEYVGGFEGSDITAHLAVNDPIYAIAKVGQAYRAAAQLTVIKQRITT